MTKITSCFRLFIVIPFVIFSTLFLPSCKTKEKETEQSAPGKTTGTPVKIISPSNEPLSETVMLNATSTFLLKSFVKSHINGYIQSVNAKLGEYITVGRVLFTLKTKESSTIDNSINKLDPDFKFSGESNIKANGAGVITQINHQAGDYVQDGEQLAVISDQNSFVFVLSVPYELKQFVRIGTNLGLLLPDGKKVAGIVSSILPTVDPVSQTLNIVIKVNETNLPENLIAKVNIAITKKANAQSLPKDALLTNDVQTEFWVMKMIDENTAVKIAVTKGMETKDRVEILQPVFAADDKIIITGNYGLTDTARVEIVK